MLTQAFRGILLVSNKLRTMKMELIMNHINDVKEHVLAEPVSINGEFCIGKDYPVEVKSAGDKGMGVFAKRKIKKGEICCYYDGIITAGKTQALFTTGEQGYSQGISDSDGDAVALAGFTTQLRYGGCAQICNDASTTYTDATDLDYFKKINVKSKQVGFKSVIFIATKIIKKGEELLYSYGPEYWKIYNERKIAIENGKENLLHTASEIWEHAVDSDETLKNMPGLANHLKTLYKTEGKTMEDYMIRYALSEYLLFIKTHIT
jgi:SET domain-containing protein